MVHSIQYLRGIAALMVVWHHARYMFPDLKIFFPSLVGAAGVDIFFVISGFIMTLTTDNKNISPLMFVRRRIIRVVPMYWIMTSILVLGAISPLGSLMSTQVSIDTLYKSYLFIPHYSKTSPEHIWPILVPGWTLNYEMFFYLVFAGVLLIKQEVRAVALFVLFALLVGVGLMVELPANPLVKTYTNPVLLEFVLGVFIAKIWLSGRVVIPGALSFCIFVVGAILLVLAPFDVYGRGIGAGLMVLGALYLWKIRVPVAHTIGDASYSIYLTHLFSLPLFRLVWVKVFSDRIDIVNGWFYMVLSLVLCSIVGIACYLLIERRLSELLHSKFG